MDQEQKKVIDQLFNSFAQTGLPMSIVESAGFLNMMRTVNPNLKIKSRSHFTRNELPVLFQEYEEKLRHELEHAQHVCISFDGWSEKNNKFQITGVIVHFAKNDALVSRVLDVIDGSKMSHSGENIFLDLTKSLDYYDLTEKVSAVVRDGASNAISASNLLRKPHFDCFSHKLNLAVKDSVKAFETRIEKVTEKLMKICRKIQKLSTLARELNDMEETLGFSHLTLVKNIEIRWNTLYDMYCRAERMKQPLDMFLIEHPELPQIETKEWSLIAGVIEFLKPISETITATQKNGVTASTIIPTLEVLLMQMKEPGPFLSARNALVERLEYELEKYRSIDYLEISCLLDPRFKSNFCGESGKSSLMQLVLNKNEESSIEEETSSSEREKNAESLIRNPLLAYYEKHALQFVYDEISKQTPEFPSGGREFEEILGQIRSLLNKLPYVRTSTTQNASVDKPRSERLRKEDKDKMSEKALGNRRKEANKRNSINYNKNKKEKEINLMKDFARLNTEKENMAKSLILSALNNTKNYTTDASQRMCSSEIDAMLQELEDGGNSTLRTLEEELRKREEHLKEVINDMTTKTTNANTYGSRKSRALHNRNIAKLEYEITRLHHETERLSKMENLVIYVKDPVIDKHCLEIGLEMWKTSREFIESSHILSTERCKRAPFAQAVADVLL
uniref:Zinc finger BED domain-containing protein 4 n=1 Tax=Caenorhabditis japonica TaxID=281687 RepID=A0A8R1HLV8_CAEJA